MKRPHERLLSHVPRLLAVVQHLVGQTPHPLTVLLDQRLERRGVSGEAPLDERALVDSGGLGESGGTGGGRPGVRGDHRPTPPWASRPLFGLGAGGRGGGPVYRPAPHAAPPPPAARG